MLGVGIEWFELTKNSVEVVVLVFRVHFPLFTEVDAADPLVFQLLEGRFGLNYQSNTRIISASSYSRSHKT